MAKKGGPDSPLPPDQAMARAPLYPFRGGGPLALLVLALLAVPPYAGLLAWPLLVLLAAMVVRESVRNGDLLPHPPGLLVLLRHPDTPDLFLRSMIGTCIAASPILLALFLLLLARMLPELGALDTIASLAVPIGFFFGWVGLAFVPAALLLAVSDPDPLAMLRARKIRWATESLGAATITVLLGAFLLLILLGAVNATLPNLLARGVGMALVGIFFLTVARLAGLGARSRVRVY